MTPIEALLSRLDAFDIRPNGSDRWRCRCPAHDGTNRSTLSIGVGENGAVLLRCWTGCALEDITAAIGLDVADLFPPKAGGGSSPLRRRRLITAGQALEVLNCEAGLIAVAACNIAGGVALTEEDKHRLVDAAGRIAELYREARS